MLLKYSHEKKKKEEAIFLNYVIFNKMKEELTPI